MESTTQTLLFTQSERAFKQFDWKKTRLRSSPLMRWIGRRCEKSLCNGSDQNRRPKTWKISNYCFHAQTTGRSASQTTIFLADLRRPFVAVFRREPNPSL